MSTETNPSSAVKPTQSFSAVVTRAKQGAEQLGHSKLIPVFFIYGFVASEDIGQPLIDLGATPEKVLEKIAEITFQRPANPTTQLIISRETERLARQCTILAQQWRTPIRASYLINILLTTPGQANTVLRKLKIMPQDLEDKNVLQRIRDIESRQINRLKIR